MSRDATPLDVIEGRAKWCVVCADNRDVLPTLPNVDAVVTDPPYGIGEGGGRQHARLRPTAKWSNPKAVNYAEGGWDSAPPDSALIGLVIEAAPSVVLFGGNYFNLPPSRCWLVWDKETSGDFADCELAWTNLDMAVRRIRYLWSGFKKYGYEERGQHPTQKPVGVMQWVLELATEPGHVVLDPFCGSGTTGVACLRLGRRFIGIELDSNYAAIAVERLEAESRGLTLRDARAGQLSLLGDNP